MTSDKENATLDCVAKASVCVRCTTLQDKLINSEENARESLDKYNQILAEGERLYAQYEIKCNKLKEMNEHVASLQDENQKLFDQNQSFAERYAAILSQMVGPGGQPTTELQRTIEDLQRSCQDGEERVEQMQRMLTASEDENASMQSNMAMAQARLVDLTTELEEIRANQQPPFTLAIEVIIPSGPTAAEARAAELYTVADPEVLQSMSPSALREQIDQVCISNELLRDEVRGLHTTIHSLEHRIVMKGQEVTRKEEEIANLTRTVALFGDKSEEGRLRELRLAEQADELQALRLRLDDVTRDMDDLNSRNSRLNSALIEERSVAQKSMDAGKQQSEAALLEKNIAIDELQRELGELKSDSARLANLDYQNDSLRTEEQRLRVQLTQQQAAYTNAQADLRRVYMKHKKDLADLEHKYQHDAYIARYETLALERDATCRTLEAIKQGAPRLMRVMQLNATIMSALSSAKLQLERQQQAMRQTAIDSAQVVRAAQANLSAALDTNSALSEKIEAMTFELATARQDSAWERRKVDDADQEKRELTERIRVLEMKAVVVRISDSAANSSEMAAISASLSNSLEAQRAQLADQEWDLLKSRAEIEAESSANAKRQLELESEFIRLQEIEMKAESEQSELRRLKREKDELTEFIEQEREINSEMTADLERSNAALQEQLKNDQAELLRLKSSSDGKTNGVSEANLVAVNAALVAVTEQLEQESGRLAHARSLFAACQDDLIRERARIVQLQGVLEERDSDIEKFHAEGDSRLERSQSDCAALTKKLSEARAATLEAESRRQAVETKMTALRQQAKAAASAVEDLENRNSDLTTELEDIEQQAQRQMEQSRNIIARLQSERDQLEERVQVCSMELATQQGRCEAVETRHANLLGAQKKIEASRRNLQAQHDAVVAESLAAGKRIVELESDKEQLFLQLQVYYADQSTATPGQADEQCRVIAALETERASLQKSLREYQQDMCNLQEKVVEYNAKVGRYKIRSEGKLAFVKRQREASITFGEGADNCIVELLKVCPDEQLRNSVGARINELRVIMNRDSS